MFPCGSDWRLYCSNESKEKLWFGSDVGGSGNRGSAQRRYLYRLKQAGIHLTQDRGRVSRTEENLMTHALWSWRDLIWTVSRGGLRKFFRRSTVTDDLLLASDSGWTNIPANRCSKECNSISNLASQNQSLPRIQWELFGKIIWYRKEPGSFLLLSKIKAEVSK